VEKRAFYFHHPLHGHVLSAQQVASAISKYGWLPSRDPSGLGARYIEAQVWTRRLAEFTHEPVFDQKIAQDAS
jgi:hypothetical protein